MFYWTVLEYLSVFWILDFGFAFPGYWLFHTNQLLNTKLIVASRPYNCIITLFYLYGKYYNHSKPSYMALGK